VRPCRYSRADGVHFVQEVAMKVLLLMALFLPAVAWGRSCNPWRVVIVYPRPVQKRVVRRPWQPRPLRPVAKPKPDEEEMPSWWSMPRDPNAPVFISGSAEKPSVDEYKEWRRTRKPRPPDPKRKMIDEDRATREFLWKILEDETE